MYQARLRQLPGLGQLAQCDAERGWPVTSTAVRAVLAARVAHLLEPGHLVAEVRRVCRPGGVFLVGRVRRDPDSAKSRLRTRRAELLRDRGLMPRDGAQNTRQLLDRLVAVGGSALGARTAADWTASTSLDRVLRGWEAMPTMGGVELPATVRAAILRELRDWAARELGDLARVRGFTERYTLEGVRLPETAGAAMAAPAPAAFTIEPSGDTWTTRC
jgi:SAM-dependent methyltransferase